jgi:hypothetical protein
MLCAGRRTVIAPAGARTCSEQRRASPAVLLPARRLASTRASAVKLQLRRRRVGVASAAAAAADLVPAVPAPPPKRRIAVFVEVRTTSSALVDPLIHRLSLVQNPVPHPSALQPSPFSHTSGMKNRFLNMIANLQEQGDEVRGSPHHWPRLRGRARGAEECQCLWRAA